jgi:MFS family permease
VADASNVVTSHVLAMFAPSFFTGHLIARFGVERIMGLGILILAGAGLVALQGVALPNFYLALILLGLGWNFGFIGATTMLAGAHAPHERGRMQGLNDLLVFGGVTFASLASGGLMNCSGGDAVEGWAAVNMAMVPFLALAGGSLLWLVLRRRAERTA